MASRSSVSGSGTVVRALLRWSPWVLSCGGGAEADLHVGDAAAALVGADDGAELRRHADAVGVGDGVAEEVGLGLLAGVGRCVAERAHGAMELGLHGVDQDRVGLRFGDAASAALLNGERTSRQGLQGRRELLDIASSKNGSFHVRGSD